MVSSPPLHVSHLPGFTPQVALEDLDLPQGGSGVEVGSWLGHRDPGITRHSGKLAARTAGNMGLLGFFP